MEEEPAEPTRKRDSKRESSLFEYRIAPLFMGRCIRVLDKPLGYCDVTGRICNYDNANLANLAKPGDIGNRIVKRIRGA